MYAFSVCLKYQRVSVTNRGKIALRHLKYHKIMVIMNKLQLWIRGNRSTRWLKKYPTHINAITHVGLEYSRAIISAKTEKKAIHCRHPDDDTELPPDENGWGPKNRGMVIV